MIRNGLKGVFHDSHSFRICAFSASFAALAASPAEFVCAQVFTRNSAASATTNVNNRLRCQFINGCVPGLFLIRHARQSRSDTSQFFRKPLQPEPLDIAKLCIVRDKVLPAERSDTSMFSELRGPLAVLFLIQPKRRAMPKLCPVRDKVLLNA